MRESGLVQAWLRHYMPNASLCLPEPGAGPRLVPAGQTGLSLAEMRGAFLLLLLGLLLSAAALLGERLTTLCRPPPPPLPPPLSLPLTASYPPNSTGLEPALASIQGLTKGLARLKTARHGVAADSAAPPSIQHGGDPC